MKKNLGLIITVLVLVVVFAGAFLLYKAFGAGNENLMALQGLNSSQTTASQAQVQDKGAQTTVAAATDKQTDNTQSNDQTQQTQKKYMAPDFTLKDLNGKDVKLSDFKGKIVILNFWAVWCKYCKQEMPEFNKLNAELIKGDKAVILAVDVQEDKGTITNYLDSNKISIPVVMDTDGAVATNLYGVNGFPTTFIIDRDGSLVTYFPGATTEKDIQDVLDKLK